MARLDLGQAGHRQQRLQRGAAESGQVIQARLLEGAQTDRPQTGNVGQTTGRGGAAGSSGRRRRGASRRTGLSGSTAVFGMGGLILEQ